MLLGESWNSNISRAPEEEGVPQPKPAFPFLRSPSPAYHHGVVHHLPQHCSHQGLTDPCQCHHKQQDCTLLGSRPLPTGKSKPAPTPSPSPSPLLAQRTEKLLHFLTRVAERTGATAAAQMFGCGVVQSMAQSLSHSHLCCSAQSLWLCYCGCLDLLLAYQ